MLVHEMAHLWQARSGRKPRAGCHDKQCAAKMCEIGLQPWDTGAPGSAEAGYQMGHYLIAGVLFDQSYTPFRGDGPDNRLGRCDRTFACRRKRRRSRES
jgi:hypothetical protein